MQDSNKKTLEAYEEDIQGYINNTSQEVDGEFKKWIDRALDSIPSDGRVLEIGSASGRDAEYIKQKGFNIVPTDAAEGFVSILKQRGYDARKLNILTDKIDGKYDMVFANAVFLHFNPEELRNVLEKIKGALKLNGILAFSVKEGEGSGWSDHKLKSPRFFQYWKSEPLKKLLEESGYETLEMTEIIGKGDKGWLQTIAK